MENSIIVDLNV